MYYFDKIIPRSDMRGIFDFNILHKCNNGNNGIRCVYIIYIKFNTNKGDIVVRIFSTLWSHVVTMASFNTNKGDIVVWIFSHSNSTTILPEICRSEPDNCYGFV